MPLLVDTGVLFALADRSDAWHRRARTCLASTHDTLLIPVTVLPEVAYLLHERIGPDAERAFIHSIAERELAVEEVQARDWRRIEELMGDYPAIGMVDASIVALAERLKLTSIATTDRQHFGVIRPKHTERFTLVP
jgi:predicted nucleic acid-binding protein